MRKHLYPYIHSSTNHNSTDMEETQIPTEKGLDREITVYLLYGILLSQMDEMLLFATKLSQMETIFLK